MERLIRPDADTPVHAAPGEFTYGLADGTTGTITDTSTGGCQFIGTVANPIVFGTNLTSATVNLYPAGSDVCTSGKHVVLPPTTSAPLCADDKLISVRFS